MFARRGDGRALSRIVAVRLSKLNAQWICEAWTESLADVVVTEATTVLFRR
jgi:hypothetical protein